MRTEIGLVEVLISDDPKCDVYVTLLDDDELGLIIDLRAFYHEYGLNARKGFHFPLSELQKLIQLDKTLKEIVQSAED